MRLSYFEERRITMIFYFSATGNCKYVAQKLAEATNDRIISITECSKENKYHFELQSREKIGFVTPVYFWGLPTVVLDFLERQELQQTDKHYVYHIVTFGTLNGKAQIMMRDALKKKGITLNGKFMVQMVDTWTPVFDLSDSEKNRKDTQAADSMIAEAIQKIKGEITGDFNKKKGPPIGGVFYKLYGTARRTKKFKVEDSCIGCGLCAKNCPVDAIELQDKKPVWVKERCALCLACLHRCPKFSIQYGKNTKKHGQFVNPYVKL